jgi:acyl carrier protein
VLEAVIAGVPERWPLTGVVHAAGLDRPALLEAASVGSVEGVLGAKVAGTILLDELTRDLPLDLFVVFSSIAATWGAGGQGAYAAGNAFLDAWVEHRRDQGLPGTSIAWGPWAGAGMVAQSDAEALLRRRGLSPMDPGLAVRALAEAVDRGESGLTIADVDWSTFAEAFTVMRPSPLLTALPEAAYALASNSALAEPGGGGGGSGTAAGAELRQRLAETPAAQRQRILLDLVRTAAATVLRHPDPYAIGAGQAFKDLGFDSLMAVEFRDHLNRETGLRLPVGLVFNFRSPQAVAAMLLTDLAPEPTASEDSDPRDADIRRALTAIPIARLRESGLMDALLKLADTNGDGEPASNERLDSLDDLDADALIHIALDAGRREDAHSGEADDQ